MTPYFGGFEIVGSGLLGPRAVYVDIETSYGTSKLYQLYAGRTLIGCTVSTSDTRITGQLNPSGSPPPLTVVAVDPSDAATDFGDLIPDGPSNQFALNWTTAGSPSDMDHFLITGSVAAGGAIDPNNVIQKVPFIGDGNYTEDLPPLKACGTWQFAVTPYDNAQPKGNAGTARTVSIDATIPPADLVPDSAGNRFEVSDPSGTLSVSGTYPS